MPSPIHVLLRSFFIAVFSALTVFGQLKPATPPAASENFPDQIAGVEKAMAAEMSASALKAFDAAGARVREGYLKALAAACDVAAKEPDAAAVIKTEKTAIAAGRLPPPADDAATPPV